MPIIPVRVKKPVNIFVSEKGKPRVTGGRKATGPDNSG